MGKKLHGSTPLMHLAAFGVLLCFLLGVLAGCGSQESAAPEKRMSNSPGSSSAQASRMTGPGKSGDQQREVPDSDPIAAIKADKPVSTAKPAAGNSAAKTDPAGEHASTVKFDVNQSEVIPSPVPGQRGPTQAQIKALVERNSKFTPESLEVIPPPEPGQPGITQAEMTAARKSRESSEIEADLHEIAPPRGPGQPGATRAEVDAVLGLEGDMKNGSFEVVPPDRPGGNGVTQAEVAALGALQPNGDRGLLPVSKNPVGK